MPLVADEQGRCLGFGQAGPGSWEAVEWEAWPVLHDIVGQALTQAQTDMESLAGAASAMPVTIGRKIGSVM
ncbi:MAG: hypothetical protein R3C44_04690 [Chloroflexota bacterium]